MPLKLRKMIACDISTFYNKMTSIILRTKSMKKINYQK